MAGPIGKMIGPIELTPDEQALWEDGHLKSESLSHLQYCDRLAAFEAQHQVAKSLLERGAVPDVRLRYFTHPRLNLRGHGKSRREVFEQNGTQGAQILGHPHFRKYLRYFVLGPDLPPPTIDEFEELVRDCEPITSGDVESFRSLARQQAREYGLDRLTAAEEFFKLGLELGLDLGTSRAIRDSVMQIREA